MGLPSIDTYLQQEIESKLKIIQTNRYIIEEILKGVQPKVARNFLRVYSGKKYREIPIVYTMPQEKVLQRGAIYIGLREGEETNPSLGNIEDTYDFNEKGLRKDLCKMYATPEKDRLYMEVTEEIGELINVENLVFSVNDNVTVEGKRIYFMYDPELEGLDFYVNYLATTGLEEEGLKKGFTTTEHYSVLAVSTNMDTVRCIDLILKAIFIMMRENPEEQNNFLLQGLQFGQIEEVNTGRTSADGKIPEILYGRETIVSYKVSYSLDVVPIMTKLKEIKVNTRFVDSYEGRGEDK